MLTISLDLRTNLFNSLSGFSKELISINLLALLAHPKASITNVYSGELNIVADVGFDHWRKALSLDYLRDVFKGEEIFINLSLIIIAAP